MTNQPVITIVSLYQPRGFHHPGGDPMNKRRLTLGLLSVWIFSFLTGATHVTASPSTEITVNSTADVIADDGQWTLREAITTANNNTPSGTFEGECPAGDNSL